MSLVVKFEVHPNDMPNRSMEIFELRITNVDGDEYSADYQYTLTDKYGATLAKDMIFDHIREDGALQLATEILNRIIDKSEKLK